MEPCVFTCIAIPMGEFSMNGTEEIQGKFILPDNDIFSGQLCWRPQHSFMESAKVLTGGVAPSVLSLVAIGLEGL